MESTTVFGRTPDVSGDSRRAYSSNENLDGILLYFVPHVGSLT
jgi:hypothetical protein